MTAPEFARFIVKLTPTPDGCWRWMGARLDHGYGVLGVSTEKGWRARLAHRLAYEHFIGPIPEDKQIDHVCRNRACANPTHMEAVTARENVRRGIAPVTTAARNRLSRGVPKSPRSAQHLAKLRTILTRNHAQRRGVPMSAATKERMAVARRAWWARKRGEAA